MAEEIVDFLIIGSGPSGAAATWSLADTGARIMCMEQGDFMKQADYPSNFRDWEGREGHWPNLKKRDSGPSINARGPSVIPAPIFSKCPPYENHILNPNCSFAAGGINSKASVFVASTLFSAVRNWGPT